MAYASAGALDPLIVAFGPTSPLLTARGRMGRVGLTGVDSEMGSWYQSVAYPVLCEERLR